MNNNNICYLLALATALLASSCAPSKEEAKKEYVQRCIESADKEYPSGEAQQAMHEFCECCGEKVVSTFSNREILDMTKQGDEKKRQEDVNKLLPVIQSCTDEMQKKMEGLEQQ